MKGVFDFDDLSELCTSENEKDGVWVDVVLYGKPMNLKAFIYGETSEEVQKYQKKKLRENMKKLNLRNGFDSAIDDDTLEDFIGEDEDEEIAYVRLGGLSKLDGTPLKFDGKEVPVKKEEGGKETEEIYRGILRGMPALGNFIVGISRDRKHFLPGRKKN